MTPGPVHTHETATMSSFNSNLRLNLTGAEADPVLRAERYNTAIEMAAYADSHGFAHINLEEHTWPPTAGCPLP